LFEVLLLPPAEEACPVLEYAEKGCLGAFIDRAEWVMIPSILNVLKQMLYAVQYLHNNGYFHQDIKPWNILIDAEGRAIVGNFGIGHSFDSASMVVGSPAYQAPEALDDSYCSDDVELLPEKGDMRALGMTFYQLLSQRLPFRGENLLRS
jgi:serine/threonine-protein kinase 11